MYSREETLEILKEKFEIDKAYKLLDYFESRVRTDVATQKDIYELKLEVEKVRAELRTEIEKMRADMLKWNFGFWLSQVVLLTGILFKLFS